MNKSDFKKLLSEKVMILDGAMGTELQKRGYLTAGAPEELNITEPWKLQEVYKDYLEAGSEFILTNTFGCNRLKLKDYNLESRLAELNQAGVRIAREVAQKYGALVAADIGPLGAYLTPLGNVTFEEAYDVFAEQVKALAAAKPDLMVIETMAEIREVKAALLAAKDHFNGPVIVQMTFTSDGTTVAGTGLLSFLSIVESMGADALGMNCSVGPKDLAALAKTLAGSTKLPISSKPNAGMPKLVNRQTVFPGTSEEFVAATIEAYEAGVNMFGGCCGSTPDFIRAVAKALKGKKPAARTGKKSFILSSRAKAVDLAAVSGVVVIGERINPTNRKKFQEDLAAGNFAVLRREAQDQAKSGAHILDINLGIPGADEKALMKKAVEEIQEVVAVPLCLDSSSADVLEEGIKMCAGKPIINSVNGDDAKLDRILPLARRYGAAVIGLTTDERGLPKSATERLAIAERILAKAREHGLPESEIIFDYLTLSVSAMAGQTVETLEAIRQSKQRWPDCRTVLGVSNISFGLPARQFLNSTFLKMATQAGLDMAILNPHEDWSLDDLAARELLLGNDPNSEHYIARHGNAPKKIAPTGGAKAPAEIRLLDAVIEGNREEVGGLVKETLEKGKQPLEIANDIILKGLNEVGVKFNSKEYFLPQVIRSAEAAQAAFAHIKPLLKKDAAFSAGRIVLATVKGDVHDIGKNIVAAVLESHGWEVIDLGKNIDAGEIVAAAKKEKVPVIGLSALMTTTMLEMEKVIQETKAAGLAAKVMVGGAPVTEKFAREIGADGYAKDAVEAAKTAGKLING